MTDKKCKLCLRTPVKDVPGLYKLPAQYARFIVDKPARLTITSLKIVEPANYKEIDVEHAIADVELAGGANQGLQVGMVIDVDDDRNQLGTLKLTKVEPTKSWGRCTAPVIENRCYLPKVGSQIVLPGAQPEAGATRKTR